MGNHDVGRAFAAAAEAFYVGNGGRVPQKDVALKALEAAGQFYNGSDAEFDDETVGDTPLNRLIAIAFDATPEEMESRDSDDDGLWYDGPYTRFAKHFAFC